MRRNQVCSDMIKYFGIGLDRFLVQAISVIQFG